MKNIITKILSKHMAFIWALILLIILLIVCAFIVIPFFIIFKINL
jgi:hypothetical protein